MSQLAGRCRAQACGSRLATTLVGAAFGRSTAGRSVHRLGPRVAGAVAVRQPARAAARARALGRLPCLGDRGAFADVSLKGGRAC